MEYNYTDIIDKLSKKGSILGLDTMRHLLDVLKHPEDSLKIVHIAGTNGKGSTLAFLAEILMKCGYSVGRYISPTIICYEERFQINHNFIEKERLETYFKNIMDASALMEEMGWETPTIFEAETAIALMYFKDEKVDYALIETGMGGLMDATNAIAHPFLTMIASISEDHKAFLGDSIEKIAGQKAGIIKSCAPVILAANPAEVDEVIRQTCIKNHTILHKVEEEAIIIEETPTGNLFHKNGRNYEIHLPGRHQVDNALSALTAAEVLQKMDGGEKITEQGIRDGLKSTRWPGRLELIATNPPFYLDGAHNPDGAFKLAAFLEKHFTNKRIVYIMGVLRDKEYDIMLSYLMPLAQCAYVFTPANQRGLDSRILADAIEPYGIPVRVCSDVSEAVTKALSDVRDADCYVLCGSLSFIEDFRNACIDIGKIRS